MGKKGLLALLHADRIDDRLARHAFEARLDHRPFRTVDHYRHARDVGLGGEQFKEGGHCQLGIEQTLVHIHVDDLGTVLHLLPGNLDRFYIVSRHDQLLECRRSGDVGALADIDELGGGSGGHRFLVLLFLLWCRSGVGTRASACALMTRANFNGMDDGRARIRRPSSSDRGQPAGCDGRAHAARAAPCRPPPPPWRQYGPASSRSSRPRR